MGTYCFDFIDQKSHSVNTPVGWKIFTIPDTHDYMPSQQLLSVEAAFGVNEKDILPGEEKYVVPEGLRFNISIPNQGNVTITVPRRDYGSHVANLCW
jgi:hypothetical protein